MKGQQRCNHYQKRRFVANVQTAKIAFGLKVSRPSMPFDSQPVIECLKWKIRIGRCFNFNDDQSSGCRDCQQINNAAILAHETGHLRINPSGTNRKKITDLTN